MIPYIPSINTEKMHEQMSDWLRHWLQVQSTGINRFLCLSKVFVFNPSEENRLGSGGAGEVFLGMYKKEKVAVKRFYSSNGTR